MKKTLRLKSWAVNTGLIILVSLVSMNLFIEVNSIVKPALTIVAVAIAVILVNDSNK